MSRISDLMGRALTRLRGDLGSPVFTFNGRDIPCVPNTLTIGSTVAIGGFDMAVSLSLYVERTEFANSLTADTTLVTVDSEVHTVDGDGTQPVSGRTLVYLTNTYRIVSARFDASQRYMTIMCADPNR